MSSSRGGRSRPGGVRRPQSTARIRAVTESVRSGPKFTGRAVILLSVMVLLIASYTSALHTWWAQRQEVQETRAEIVMRREAIRDLENTKRRFDDPAFIERQARERFGWVMPGEVGYRVIGIDGTIQGEIPAPSTLPEEKKVRWYDVVWSSVEGAGRDPKEAPPPADPDKVLRE
jgi:cell division protein FtsB